MAYYLSKSNEAFLLPLIPKLKNATTDLKIPTENPERLEYILRSAAGNPKYSWIRDKYIIRLREGYILCKIKFPGVEIGNDKGKVVEILSKFFDIANELVLNKPDKVIFKYYELDEDDYSKLQLFCDNNNYKMEESNDELTFTKN
jgi:hypothetical protein